MDEQNNEQEQEQKQEKEQVDEYKELKEALAKERNARKEAERLAKKLETDKETSERASLEQKEEYKKLWETDKEKLAQLEQKIKDDAISGELKAIANSITKDGNKRDDIIALYNKHATYTENGVSFTHSGIECTRDELIERIKADRPYLVDGSQATGGGSAGGGGGSVKAFSELTERERVELYNHSPEKYAQRRDAEKQ